MRRGLCTATSVRRWCVAIVVAFLLAQTPAQTADREPIALAVARDERVLNDPLYPPLNRSDRRTFETLPRALAEQDNREDTFRLVGYLSCTCCGVAQASGAPDAGGGRWKLFARMKDRHQGEFYMVPTDRALDVKVPLTPDVMAGERLRDLYSIPRELRFRSPLLAGCAYEFTEIPKPDLSTGASRYT